jgi:hypothetical protein
MRNIDGSSERQDPAPNVTHKIDEVVTAIRLEAERRDLGEGTILISAERLRQIMCLVFLA